VWREQPSRRNSRYTTVSRKDTSGKRTFNKREREVQEKRKRMEKMEEPMPVFEQECSYDEENALLICNIKPILFNCRDLATASTSCVVPAFNDLLMLQISL
jgi:hypothetical protein